MRVAFLVNEFPKISETFILDQLTFLLDRGCEVDIFAQRLYAHEPIVHRDVLAYSLMDNARSFVAPAAASKPLRVARALFDVARALPRSPRLVLRSLDFRHWGMEAAKFRPFYRVAPFLDRSRYDLVHAHFGPIGEVGAQLRKAGAFDGPLLTQFHGFDASSYLRERGDDVYRELFAEGDVFLCVSERIRRRLIDIGCAESKTLVHRTGVKVGSIRFEPHRGAVGEPIEILTVGRLVEKKGIEFGLRAFALFVREHPHARYTIVGDGPQEAMLAQLAAELRIADRVIFAGALAREAVALLMARSQILLAPSVAAASGDEEGIPVVLMEAMAGGLPVVSTQHAGIPELISHGVSGLLAPERDAAALAEDMARLVSKPAEAEAIAGAARQVIEREYDVAKLNAALYGLYLQKLGEHRRAPARSARRWT